MFPSKFLQFPSILTHFHAANEKIQNGGRDLAISRGLVWVNILRPAQNGCHFTDDNPTYTFLKENVDILISLGFVPKGPYYNMSALIQVVAWCLMVPSHYLNQCWQRSLVLHCVTGLQRVKGLTETIVSMYLCIHPSIQWSIYWSIPNPPVYPYIPKDNPCIHIHVNLIICMMCHLWYISMCQIII